ncbi:hypothetical protein AALO_G00295050 [Alosa alosa]|uniref:Uncharacterized protein n=1 Tax=Alosa alosa TaxID=278164 RepID=A0AAV6FD95_9TELE|nr:hypothetical protein AALO_G00295050 [Alosa alosa]
MIFPPQHQVFKIRQQLLKLEMLTSAAGGVTESREGPSEDADVATTTQNGQNQTTSDHTVGTDGASEDAVLTTVLNLQNGTTSVQDGTGI